MQRAHSTVQLKSVGTDEQRVITGLATSPIPDRVGDVVDPFGVRVASDIPLFLYHDSRLTVGRARLGKPTSAGIPFEAHLPKIDEAGPLKDRVDEAWQMLKHGLITGVSIGFRVLGDAVERIAGGGTRFLRTEIVELSLCPVPMHPLATVNSVKAAADLALQRARLASSSPNNQRGTPKMYAILRLDSNLQLSLDYDYSKKATVVLSRIMAQRLADELQAFANNRKSVDGLREMALPVEMLPPDAVQRGLLTRPPVKLDGHGSKTVRLGTSAKATGVVHLQPAAPKKGGVLYLDQTGTKGKLPVVRLKR